MQAFLEVSSGIIRVISDGATYGDVYDFAIFFVGDEDTAILKGLRIDDRRFTIRHKRAIVRCLKQAGFKRACWDRYKLSESGKEKHRYVLELYTRKFSVSNLSSSFVEAQKMSVALG